MVDVNKLPLSTTSFSNFILKNKIYVDKTDLIAKLALGDTPIFLSRPRRFGKSTLVSTFEELFSHGLEKFKGLKIERENLWQDKTYKVIHLDFSKIKDKDETVSFNNDLLAQLDAKFKARGFRPCLTANIKNPAQYLDERFSDPEINELVLLIDEYDAPLTSVMDDKEEFEKRRKILSKFFINIKSYSEKFRFIFITGVTRYSQVSIFSAFNILKDISFNPLYGSIVGYTQEELEFYFKDYLENAAKVLNQKKNTNEYTYKSILQSVKDNYDGYSFDDECSTHIYNPWSILNFLESPEREFKTYWVDTGGAQPSLLEKYLETVDKRELRQSKLLEFSDLQTTISANSRDLSPNISTLSDANFPFLAILYQAGYFTIKQSDGMEFEVGIPNLEVKQAFADIIVKNLTNCTSSRNFSKTYVDVLLGGLENKDLEKIKEAFNIIIGKYVYDALKDFTEAIFRDTFKLALDITNLGIEVKDTLIETQREVMTKHGRIDLLVEVKNYIYVIELKVASTLGQVEGKLKEAYDQIIKLDYADIKENKGQKVVSEIKKQVVALACVIVNQSKSTDRENAVRRVEKLEEVPLLENKQ